MQHALLMKRKGLFKIHNGGSDDELGSKAIQSRLCTTFDRFYVQRLSELVVEGYFNLVNTFNRAFDALALGLEIDFLG